MWKPELLSPAGSLDKLKVAVSYGADAVYLAGQKFGLRTAAENFTAEELAEGIEFAHKAQSKVFAVLNGFLHDKDLEELPEFLGLLTELQADALIISDLGVIETAKKYSKIPIHLSTQASCLNRYSGKLWKKMGVERLIFGREVSIADAGKIKKETGLEVELFIHGSMCMAFSGHCTISNYTQGRDSNRGGCAQSCRFNYSLELDSTGSEQKNISETAFMSSKDLKGLEVLPLFFEHQIDSLKIEGRMRSPLYAGMISKVYREAIDVYATSGKLPMDRLEAWNKELSLLPHRAYTEASLIVPAGRGSVHDESNNSTRTEMYYLGLVRKVIDNEYAVIETKVGFSLETPIEVVSALGENIPLNPPYLSALGETLEQVKPSSLFRIPYHPGIQEGQILRKQKWLSN